MMILFHTTKYIHTVKKHDTLVKLLQQLGSLGPAQSPLPYSTASDMQL